MSPRKRRLRGPLRGVVEVRDVGDEWRATLECGHVVGRPKRYGRMTVYRRCYCSACAVARA
jgi:hypothetical protein